MKGQNYISPGGGPPPQFVPANPTPPRKRSRPVRIALYGFIGACILTALVLVALAGVYIYFAMSMPSVDQFGRLDLTQSTKIFDRNGNLLYETLLSEGGRRTLLRPDQIAPVMKQATIATEDPSFYSNLGVDPVGVLRAIYYNVLPGDRVVGGSTITQQLVKNTLLSPEQTLTRKVQEAILAVEITRRYPKDQILTSYLNTIYYGNYSYGIGAAAKAYFDKDASQLDLAEASLLAGLPQAPSLYEPCDNVEGALARQKTVLDLMIKSKYIDQAQAEQAAQEMAAYLTAPDFAKHCTVPQVQLQAPHFVDYVRQQLEQRYGPEVMSKGGLQVTTSIDMNLQKIAEDEARKQIQALAGKNVTNAAVVMIDPHTGEILAMVGSVDFSNAAISGQVNIANSPRQPGSSIKPINYVTAFGQGWTPATPVYDLKTDFPSGSSQPYVPTDYDGRQHGLVSVRTALANSLNIPAVKAEYATSTKGPNGLPEPLAMIDTAKRLGITTLTGAGGQAGTPYGLALTLGGGEVTLVEMTDAYAGFANLGARMPATPYTKIVDGHGHVIYDVKGKDKPKPVCAGFDPKAQNEQPDGNGNCAKSAPFAYLITSILSDNQARALSFGTHTVLELGRPAAVKTGTTNDFRDNWTIGYTPDLVTGVWVGNANNTPMQDSTGITGAAPIWHNIMERALQDRPAQDFPVPPGVAHGTICTDSGLLATDLCPANHRRDEVFVSGYEPKEKDNVWQRIDCGGASEVLEVPPHDVGDLIPYARIRAWAASAGWRLAPANGLACNGAAPSTGGGGPAQVPGENKGNGKGGKKKGKP